MRGMWRLAKWRDAWRERRRLRQALRAVRRFPTIAHKVPHGLPAPLLISLTSYPPRFPTLAPALKSLLDQTIAADRTILWLAHGDVAKLPSEVLALVAHGLEIRETEDIRPYKKLIPALQLCPDAFIVTADDDVYYPPTWLGALVAESRRNPVPSVVAWRAHLAARNPDGSLTDYAGWDFDTPLQAAPDPGRVLFPTGVGGILYPPRGFSDRVIDRAAFMRVCPQGDDIWFAWMAKAVGTPTVRVPGRFEIVYWPASQGVALWHENLAGRNDVQIRAIEERFGMYGTALAVAVPMQRHG